MSSPSAPKGPLHEYVVSIVQDTLKPALSFMRHRKSIIKQPTIAVDDPAALGTDWKGPVRYALQGTIYVSVASNLIVIAAICMNQPHPMPRIKELLSVSSQVTPITAPLALILGSYLLRSFLVGQPQVSEDWARRSAHILHLTYVFSLFFWPTLLFSAALNLFFSFPAHESNNSLALAFIAICAANVWIIVMIVKQRHQLRNAFRAGLGTILLGLWLANVVAMIVVFFVAHAIVSLASAFTQEAIGKREA